MSSIYRLTAFLAFAALSACSPKQGGDSGSALKVAGRQVGGFKGLSQIQVLVNDRLFKSQNHFNMSQLLGPELNALLGAFSDVPTTSQFEAAAPNPVNTLLWDILMDQTATSIASEVRETDGGTSLDDSFQSTLKQLVAAPQGKDSSEDLRDLWHEFMRYDAPESERDIWVAAMTAPESDWQANEGRARTRAILQSLLMHPYFLLEH